MALGAHRAKRFPATDSDPVEHQIEGDRATRVERGHHLGSTELMCFVDAMRPTHHSPSVT